MTTNNNSKQESQPKKCSPSTVKIVFAVTVMLITSCSMGGGFSRNQAAEAIMQDSRYNTASAISTDLGSLPNGGAQVPQISEDDTLEAAAIRAKKDFQKRHPQIMVAEHLGYLKFHLDGGNLGPRVLEMPYEYYKKNYGMWKFKPRAEITEKGKELWKETNLPEQPLQLPIAVRNEPVISGIVDEDKITKKVEFTTSWKPTTFGLAFDPTMKEFSELPPELQEDLKRTQKVSIMGAKNRTANFNHKQKGITYFRKYDDESWRMFNFSIF